MINGDGGAAGGSARKFSSLAVFCGASSGRRKEFADAVEALGTEMAKRGIRLVYGGGNVGLMGVVARTVSGISGKESVVGVIPKELSTVECSGDGMEIATHHVVEGMHERKAMMAELAEGFVCLPGGYGTLEEVLEMITWQQLGYHTKPVGVLNCCGFYDKLLEHFDHCVNEGFVRPAYRDIVISSADPAELLDLMAAYEPHMGHIQAANSGIFKHDDNPWKESDSSMPKK